MSCVYCPIVARQLCSVQYTILQLLPYLTLPVVNLFWLAGVFLAEGAGHERCYQGLKWVGTHGNAVPRPAIFCNPAFRGLKQRFSRGNACLIPRPER